MSYAGFCEKCGVPYYESDRLAHEHKTAEPAVVSASPEPWDIVMCTECNVLFKVPQGTEKTQCKNCGKHLTLFPAAQPVAADLTKPSPEYDALLTEAVKRKGQPPDIQRLAEDSYRAGEAEYGADLPKVEEAIDALEDLLTNYVEDSENGTMYWTAEGREKAAAILRPYFQGSQTPDNKRAEIIFDKLAEGGFFEDVKDWPLESRNECLEILRELAVAPVSGNGPEPPDALLKAVRESILELKHVASRDIEPPFEIHAEALQICMEREAIKLEEALAWAASHNGPEPLRPQDLFKREWSDDFSEDMWNGHQMCAFAESYHKIAAGAASHNGQGWVRVEDRMPKDGQLIQIAMRDGLIMTARFKHTNGTEKFRSVPGEWAYHPTHWRELTAPPSEANVPKGALQKWRANKKQEQANVPTEEK